MSKGIDKLAQDFVEGRKPTNLEYVRALGINERLWDAHRKSTN